MQSVAPGVQQLWSLSGHLAVTTVLRSVGAAASANEEDRTAMLQVKAILDTPSAAWHIPSCHLQKGQGKVTASPD